MISIEAYCASIGRFYDRLKDSTNAQNVVSIRSGNVHIILLSLLFLLLYLSILLHDIFALFMLVTIDVVYVNTVRFKRIDSSCHFLELDYIGYNLNFLKLKLLLDSDVESNPGPTQNDCKYPVGHPKKIKVFKGTAKKFDLTEIKVHVASDLKVQNCFVNKIQPVSLDIIKPCSVTCPSTLESLQKLEFEVNNDVNVKVSLCQGDITQLNVDVIVNSVNKTLTAVGAIDAAIHEAKVTLSHKLPAKYVFHTVRLRDKNDYKLNDFYKSCLEKVLAYNVKSIAFCCGTIGIPGFDPREAVKMAIATVRLWLELNHSSIERVIFCTNENEDYEIYKDLMTTVYFPVSKYHLTNINMKESANVDCVVNKKSVEISNELGQSLLGVQIYPNFGQNSESESFAGRSKRISSKVDFNIIRDTNISFGLLNYG